jgi:hypothetical protein
LLVDGLAPTGASALLTELLLDIPGAAVGPDHGWRLTLCDRDWLVSGLHQRLFGDQVELITRCERCGRNFELTFSLSQLLQDRLDRRPPLGDAVVVTDVEGYYAFASSGLRFRPPTTDDERALSRVTDPDGSLLVDRLVADWGSVDPNDPAQLEAAHEAIDVALAGLVPLLVVGLPVRCVSCGFEQTVSFDMVSFFLQALARERGLLLSEVHRVALAYHWTATEILDLERRDRRAYVALIETERGAVA